MFSQMLFLLVKKWKLDPIPSQIQQTILVRIDLLLIQITVRDHVTSLKNI